MGRGNLKLSQTVKAYHEIKQTSSTNDFWPYITLECHKCFKEIGSVAFNPNNDKDLISQESVLCPKCYDKVFPY